MSVVDSLIGKESNGKLCFGNYELPEKKKLSDYEYEGDLYKVKTFEQITKLEKNGLFVYESVPGTAVHDFSMKAEGVSFIVEGPEDAQITIGLEEETEYEVYVDNVLLSSMKTNLSGKLAIGLELDKGKSLEVNIKKMER